MSLVTPRKQTKSRSATDGISVKAGTVTSLPAYIHLSETRKHNEGDTLKSIKINLGDTAKVYHNIFIYDIEDIKSAETCKTLVCPCVLARQFFPFCVQCIM